MSQNRTRDNETAGNLRFAHSLNFLSSRLMRKTYFLETSKVRKGLSYFYRKSRSRLVSPKTFDDSRLPRYYDVIVQKTGMCVSDNSHPHQYSSRCCNIMKEALTTTKIRTRNLTTHLIKQRQLRNQFTDQIY